MPSLLERTPASVAQRYLCDPQILKEKNRLLRFICPVQVPHFQPFFLLWPLRVLMRQTRQAVRANNQSIFLRCLCLHLMRSKLNLAKRWLRSGNTSLLRHSHQGILKRGKYHCTIDLLFGWLGLVCFANKNKKILVIITALTLTIAPCQDRPRSFSMGQSMDKLQGRNLGRVFIFRSGRLHAAQFGVAIKTALPKVENSAQTTSRFSPVSHCVPPDRHNQSDCSIEIR